MQFRTHFDVQHKSDRGNKMSKAFAIACSMKKRAKKMAKGGSVDEGPSEKENQMGVHKIVPNYDRAHAEVKHGQSEARYGDKKAAHKQVLSELKQMPNPKIKGLAEGGDVDDDMVSRIMMAMGGESYSEGGQVANDTPITADFESNDFDDLVHRDELEQSYTGANSGDELGDAQEDKDRNDIVKKIMSSLAKKDRMPRPA